MIPIVGIDSSLTALALGISDNARSISLHQFGSNPAKTVSARVKRYRFLAGQALDAIRSEVGNNTRVIAAIEAYAFGANGNASHWLVEFGAILRDRLDPIVEQWIEVNAMHLKVYVTGQGNADKPLIVAKCNERWGTTFEKRDHNKADAYGLTRMGMELASYRADGVDINDCVATMVSRSAPPKPVKPKPLTKRQKAKQAQLAIGGGA